ncbi:MAG: methyltransferase domain-containing protein [Deltaproteobacteria bacterium]|nr:methyltransferase domain-containing protein [Deltaproteobacteria bacterium]
MDLVVAASSSGIEHADASGRIPAADGSIDVVYSSHMLEHLPRSVARHFLGEVRRVLVPGGIVRLAVPDLALLIAEYQRHGDADRLMASSLLTAEPGSGLRARARAWIAGPRHHQWMYDGASLVRLLGELGFTDAHVVPAGTTRIPEPGPLDLYERADESLYVEARRA